MDKKKIESIVDFIEKNKDRVDISEIEVTDKDGSSIKVKLHSRHSAPMVVSGADLHGPASIAPASAIAEKQVGHVIASPMVGTVYLAPSPDAPPFIKVGQQVIAGQTLCLVEAMKMFNKIVADKSGIIKEVLVESGQAVDFDQSLVVLEDV